MNSTEGENSRGARLAANARAIGFVFIAAASLGACTPSLTGRLVTRTGDAVVSGEAAVNVTRLDKAGLDPATVVVPVSGDGEFKADLPPGTYLVESFVPDFTMTSQRVELGKTKVSLRLVLEKLPAAVPGTVGVNLKVEPTRGAGDATLTPPQL